MARWRSTTPGSVGRSLACGEVVSSKGEKAAIVLVAVEKRGRISGRIRMAVAPNFKKTTMIDFVKQTVAPGSTVLHRRPEKASRAFRPQTFSTFPVPNLSGPSCAKAYPRSCRLRTVRSVTCSSG